MHDNPHRFERSLNLATSLLIVNCLLSLPSVSADFPGNMLLLLLPAGFCFIIIPIIHRSDETRPDAWQVALETAGGCAGFGAAFHLVHGSWDYQGLFMSIVGSCILTPLIILAIRYDGQAFHVADAEEIRLPSRDEDSEK